MLGQKNKHFIPNINKKAKERKRREEERKEGRKKE